MASEGKSKEGGMISQVRNGPQGTLDIIVHEAKELRDTEVVGKNDNYAKLTLGKQTLRTKTHDDGGAIAHWEDAFSFSLKGKDNEVVMIVDVMNQNVTKDAHIGSCVIPVIDLVKSQPKKQWYQISAQGKIAGQFCISASFNPAVIIQVHECKDLHSVQMIGRQDPYVRICLGTKQKYNSKVSTDGDKNPKWFDEKLTFNKPVEMSKKEESLNNDPVFLIKVKNHNLTKDSQIGTAHIPWSAVQKAKGQGIQWLTLSRKTKIEGEKLAGQIAISVSDFKVEFPKEHQQLLSRSTTFIPVGKGPQGNMYITVHEAKGLRDTELLGKQDPFVVVNVGPGQTRRTKACEGTGAVGSWDERMLFSLQGFDDETETKLTVMNYNTLMDRMIGTCTIATIELLMDLPQKKWYSLLAEGKIAGEVCISVQFASALTIQVLEAKELYNTQFFGKQDPYVTIKCGKLKGETDTCKDGGRAPKWPADAESKLTFNKPVERPKDKKKKKKDGDKKEDGEAKVEEKKPLPDPTEDPQFIIQVWNDNFVSDALIGTAKVLWSELATRAKDNQPVWLPLTRGDASKGREQPAGQIQIQASIHKFKMPDRASLALKKEEDLKKEAARADAQKKKDEEREKKEPKADKPGVHAVEDKPKEAPVKKEVKEQNGSDHKPRTSTFVTTDAFGVKVLVTMTVQPLEGGMRQPLGATEYESQVSAKLAGMMHLQPGAQPASSLPPSSPNPSSAKPGQEKPKRAGTISGPAGSRPTSAAPAKRPSTAAKHGITDGGVGSPAGSTRPTSARPKPAENPKAAEKPKADGKERPKSAKPKAEAKPKVAAKPKSEAAKAPARTKSGIKA